MPHQKSFLIASDLSPRADYALARAAQLAVEHAAKLTVLYVQEELLLERWTKQGRSAAKKQLRDKIKTLQLPSDHPVAIRTGVGKPFVEIVRQARTAKAEVVLIGAHGAQFLKDLFVGTTAEEVIRKGDRTIVVVKRPVAGPYQRVLVAVDFSDASRRALEQVLALAPQAMFYIVYVSGPMFEEQLRLAGVSEGEILRQQRQQAQEAEERLKRFLQTVDCRNRKIHHDVEAGQSRQVIPRVAEQIGADLVAVGTTGFSGLPYLLLGSVSQHVLRTVSCDVLLARPADFHFELP